VSLPAVEFRQVYKAYPIYSSPKQRLKEFASLGRRSFHQDFWALRDISFEIPPGESFCVLGENGSGKSTLLQIVAGILRPSSGSVQVRGRVAALLELGAGFNPEFTGRNNVYLNGAILGLRRAEIEERFPLIEEFAEIGDFIDRPVKTYSSGMLVRLAFAVAIHVDPEILLVDEALAVGDIYFRQRCMRKIHELRERGVTILFVSHATADVKAIGDRAMWLDGGSIREIGPTEGVVTKYLAAMLEKDSVYREHHGDAAVREWTETPRAAVVAPEVVEYIPNIDHRFGDGRAEILGIALLQRDGTRVAQLQPNAPVMVRISVRAKREIELPIVGFMIRNHMGQDFAGTNTTRENAQLPPMSEGDVFTVDFHLQLPELYPGSFSFSPAVADGTLHQYDMCDWIDNAIALEMSRGDGEVYGHMHLPCRVALNERAVAVESGEPVPERQIG
jgi:ABC-type polysaccharide/polyol phosphate transport system ATPase subunit